MKREKWKERNELLFAFRELRGNEFIRRRQKLRPLTKLGLSSPVSSVYNLDMIQSPKKEYMLLCALFLEF